MLTVRSGKAVTLAGGGRHDRINCSLRCSGKQGRDNCDCNTTPCTTTIKHLYTWPVLVSFYQRCLEHTLPAVQNTSKPQNPKIGLLPKQPGCPADTCRQSRQRGRDGLRVGGVGGLVGIELGLRDVALREEPTIPADRRLGQLALRFDLLQVGLRRCDVGLQLVFVGQHFLEVGARLGDVARVGCGLGLLHAERAAT
jgi:hypothetical protein